MNMRIDYCMKDTNYTPIDLEIDDKLFAIVTSDRKCILKGRKTTRFILATIDEHTNYKLFTCRHVKEVLANLKCNSRRVWLTDTVKELYNIKTHEQEKELLNTLTSVRVQVKYQIKEEE